MQVEAALTSNWERKIGRFSFDCSLKYLWDLESTLRGSGTPQGIFSVKAPGAVLHVTECDAMAEAVLQDEREEPIWVYWVVNEQALESAFTWKCYETEHDL